jgi:hypothetical protein
MTHACDACGFHRAHDDDAVCDVCRGRDKAAKAAPTGFYGTTRENAERIAAALNDPQRLAAEVQARPTTRYIVDAYPGTRQFGVVRRWRYADRPDLGELGGGFERLDRIS